MNLTAFARARPFQFHLTAESNLSRIRAVRKLQCAADLLEAAGERSRISQHRPEGVRLTIGGSTVHVRDQAPLYAGNMTLDPGWSFRDFVEELNSRVFFWPGGASGPTAYGVRHHARYREKRESLAILRVATQSLMSANPRSDPGFCRFNSGSPRCSRGRKSPRGGETFQLASEFEGVPSKVVELTFKRHVTLPDDTDWGPSPTGPWTALFS